MPEPFIIAELAQGYEGRPAQAMQLLNAAAAASADAAKLQLVYAQELATPDYKHFALFRSLEMADRVWHELAEIARRLSVELHLDVFGARSLRLAAEVGAQAVKVHSTDMGNPGLLEAIAQSPIEQVLLSTGGCTAAEIEHALETLARKRVVLLHGFQGYPTPVEANQIARLREFAVRYSAGGARLGFADHAHPESALSLVLPAAALGAGATVLEKHLTLDRALKLEDYESALNPDEFADFVRHMRACARALWASSASRSRSVVPQDFAMHEAELAYRNSTRKHVVAARALSKGAKVEPADIALKRTSSLHFLQAASEVIGRRLACAVKADEAIAPQALEPLR